MHTVMLKVLLLASAVACMRLKSERALELQVKKPQRWDTCVIPMSSLAVAAEAKRQFGSIIKQNHLVILPPRPTRE